MSRDEARQHIKAAQEAEIAGNREGAVRHLERAALAYLRVGAHARAAQMYRNCVRLAPERKDLQDALDKAEHWATQRGGAALAGGADAPGAPPEHELPPAPEPSAPPTDTFDALAIPRGPQRMPEGLEAWCSFCCRPTTEVGELVAGPAGAFICSGCVRTSASMLGATPPTAPAPALAEKARPKTAPMGLVPAPKPVVWLGSEPVLLAARAALTGRGPALVVVGGEGAGKSALLDALLDERPELARVNLARMEDLPAQGGLLIEHLEHSTPAVRAELAGRGFVATWRAEVETEPLPVQLGEATHSFPVAKDFSLPPELGTAAALALGPITAEMLDRILERELEQGGPKLSPELRAALVVRALESGRGAKGLLAELGVLRSLPSGAPLELVATKPKRTRKKKP